MKLVDNTTSAQIVLPDLLWQDEFDWVPVTSTNTYALTGSLIIEQSEMLAGRPFTLVSPQTDMGWITRVQLTALKTAASILERKFTLHLEYPSDMRTFVVSFDHSEDPVQAVPVKGFPEHVDGAYYTLTLKLIEVPA